MERPACRTDRPIEMGIWGTGILQDDFAQDLYDQYVNAAARGDAPEVIIEGLRVAHAGELSADDADAVFWLAVAQAQRDARALQPEVLRRVTEIVERGIGLEPWAEAGGGELGRRKSVLTRFLKSLTCPAAPSAAARGANAPATLPDFGRGDCLSVELPDGS